MNTDPTAFKVKEIATIKKIDCSGEQRQLVETIHLVDGVITERIIYNPPIIHEEG